MPHSHHHEHNHSTSRNIAAAFFLNLLFVAIELVGGFYTNSVAILADALHDLGDCLSLGGAYVLEKISHKKRNERFPFGYKRFSLLASLLTGVILIIGSAWTLKESIPRLWNPEPVNASGMLILAVLGIAINIAGAYKLGHGHSHSEKILKWHFLEDVLGWVAVLMGAAFIYWKNWTIIDPILSVLISVFVMVSVARSLVDPIKIFLQSTPTQFDAGLFRNAVLEIDGVRDTHDIRAWSLDGTSLVLTLHVTLDDISNIPKVSFIKKTIQALANSYGDCHLTLEIESEREICRTSKNQNLHACE